MSFCVGVCSLACICLLACLPSFYLAYDNPFVSLSCFGERGEVGDNHLSYASASPVFPNCAKRISHPYFSPSTSSAVRFSPSSSFTHAHRCGTVYFPFLLLPGWGFTRGSCLCCRERPFVSTALFFFSMHHRCSSNGRRSDPLWQVHGDHPPVKLCELDKRKWSSFISFLI